MFFALAGLYLYVERGFTGRQVQRAHMQLARRPEPWSVGALPATRGTVTARDVLAAPDGVAREAVIDAWARSVWAAFADSRERVVEVLGRHGIV